VLTRKASTTLNSNPRFATDLVTVGAEESLLLIASCSPPLPHPRFKLMAGSLLLLVIIVAIVVGSLL
jgi:hypothetical protein